MKIYLTYGIGMAVIGALLGLIGFFAGVGANSGIMIALLFGFVGFLIPIIGVPLAIRAWRDGVGKGWMSYGRGVGVGFFTTVWWALGGAVWQLLYSTVINPGLRQEILDKQAAQFERMPEAQREVAEKMSHFMTNPAVQFAIALIFSCILGVIIALIASAFLKREASAVIAAPPPPVA